MERMNIDERIETLNRNVRSFYLQVQRRRIEDAWQKEARVNIDDRLEALAQSVELQYLSSRDSDKRMREFGERMDQLRQSVAELVANFDRLWMLYTSQDRSLHNLDGGQSPVG